VYCWTLLTRNIAETPYLLGVTDDLAKAQRLGEPHLLSGRAFLCLIEAVRPAMMVHSLDACYVRTGREWVGRRTVSGRVRWQERDALLAPAARRLIAAEYAIRSLCQVRRVGGSVAI
jgi:hypothetical protein